MKISGSDKQIIIRFLIVGGLGFITNYISLLFFINAFDLSKIIAEILAAIIALQITFLLHDRWTYRNRAMEYDLKIFFRYISYLMSNSSGSIATVLLFTAFSKYFENLIALGLAAMIAMVWNFFINKFFIWRRHRLSKGSMVVESEI